MTVFGNYRDFQKKGAIGSYYEDMIAACPSCRFAGYAADFAKPVPAATRAWILSTLKPKWAGKAASSADECELAAERCLFEKAKNEDVANLYLVASYLLRGASGAGDAQRRNAQRLSAKHFVLALAAGEIQAKEHAAILYLVGELERRTGAHAEAIRHFDLAAAEPGMPTWLPPILGEQRALAVKKDENNAI